MKRAFRDHITNKEITLKVLVKVVKKHIKDTSLLNMGKLGDIMFFPFEHRKLCI